MHWLADLQGSPHSYLKQRDKERCFDIVRIFKMFTCDFLVTVSHSFQLRKTNFLYIVCDIRDQQVYFHQFILMIQDFLWNLYPRWKDKMFPSFSDAFIIWWFIKIADTTNDYLDDLGEDRRDWYKISWVKPSSWSCQ